MLNELNEAQREAVAADSGSLLVLAGAGSGKTRVLVHRIVWLIREEGVSPHALLAVTFTNKVAREMRGRIEDLLNSSVHNMWVGTFHGIARRLLRIHWQEANLPQNFQILDSNDQLRLVKRVCLDLGLDDTRWPPKQAQWYINEKKDEGLRSRHIDPSPGDLYAKTMLRVYTAYEDACDRDGLVDFAELLLRAHELWLHCPEILQHYQQRFRTILVDEFQDTNTIQYAWLRVLAGQQVPVVAVGDDDQSIYGWRGAKIENIQRFSEDFKGAQVIRLEQNYRSTQIILSAANALIAHNTDRLGKNLWTAGEQGEAVSLYAAFNEQDEARFIVERTQMWIDDGNPRSTIAILYRSNAQSRVLEEALIRARVPYRIYGGQRFYEQLEIRNVLAYMRLLLIRSDDTALERVLNFPPRGIGSKTVDSLRDLARVRAVPLWQAINIAVEDELFSRRAIAALQAFQSLISELDSATLALPLHELVEYVINRSGLLEYHRAERGERGQARVENLGELISAAKSFVVEDTGLPSLRQFLDNAALDAGDAQADLYDDSVQLMTLHSAKGLEFPLVFLVGMEENLFPHRMSIDKLGGLEEERRLCYVGITRAMKKLVVTYAESRRLHGNESHNALSRFVREIPANLIQEVRLSSTVSRPLSNYRPTASAAHQAAGIDLGQRVLHQVFGEGVVTNFEGRDANARVEVKFSKEGSKWLVLKYANLQLI